MTLHLRAVLLTIAVMLVGCDHAAKYAAKADLEGRPPTVLAAGILDLRYVENTDSGFNLLRAIPESVRTPGLTAVQLVAGLVVLALCLWVRRSRLQTAALLLVSAGALGNGIDRLLRGHVVDFIYLHHWPVFNVADMYITVGAVLLAWTWRSTRSRAAWPA